MLGAQRRRQRRPRPPRGSSGSRSPPTTSVGTDSASRGLRTVPAPRRATARAVSPVEVARAPRRTTPARACPPRAAARRDRSAIAATASQRAVSRRHAGAARHEGRHQHDRRERRSSGRPRGRPARPPRGRSAPAGARSVATCSTSAAVRSAMPAGAPQLEQLALPAAVAQEARRPAARRPRGRPELGQEQQRRRVARALGSKWDRGQHPASDSTTKKALGGLSRRPRASFGTLKGPLSPETEPGLRKTYVPSVNFGTSEPLRVLLLLLGGLLLCRGLLLGLAGRLLLHGHELPPSSGLPWKPDPSELLDSLRREPQPRHNPTASGV